MRSPWTWIFVLLALLAPGLEATAWAYPEFQKASQARSGRAVNCAMCHEHPDGPDGAAFGQIGALSQDELARLNRARGAFEPGQEVDSPILNAFGDEIIRSVGKRRFLEMRSRPEDLGAALGTSDLDGDGIADGREYLDGTHPLKRTNGDPWLLFFNNVRRNVFHIVMIVLATALTVYGLASILRGTHVAHDAGREAGRRAG
jgi:hypothetical protein